MTTRIRIRTAAFGLVVAAAGTVVTSRPAEAQNGSRRGQQIPWVQPRWVNPPTFGGVRTADPFRGTNTRQFPTLPNYSGGYRGYWHNPYNGLRDNNVYRPRSYGWSDRRGISR
jgi:hypothetical protein